MPKQNRPGLKSLKSLPKTIPKAIPDPRPSKANPEHRSLRKEWEEQHSDAFEWMPWVALALTGVAVAFDVERDLRKCEEKRERMERERMERGRPRRGEEGGRRERTRDGYEVRRDSGREGWRRDGSGGWDRR